MILDLMTDTELADIRDAAAAVQAAEARTRDLRTARAKAEEQLNVIALLGEGGNARLAAARFLGEEAPAAPADKPAGMSKAELQAATDGLRLRIQESERNEQDARDRLKATIAAVTRRCMESGAEEYAKLGERIGALHADLLSGSQLIRDAGGPFDTIDVDNFLRLAIPSSIGLAALRERGRIERPTTGVRILAGGDRSLVAERAEAMRQAVLDRLQAACGFPPLAVATLRKFEVR